MLYKFNINALRVNCLRGVLSLSAVSARCVNTDPNLKMGDDVDYKKATSVYDFTVKDLKGNDVSLEKYRGHPLIIVNIASKCGLAATNNKELTELKEQFYDKGLRILAFPCNQFAHQEPDNGEEIVCKLVTAKTDFGDVFQKCNVNGDDAIPLYKYLKHKLTGTLGIGAIKWNYTKFVIDKDGQPVERHGPKTDPSSMVKNLLKYFI